MASKKANWNIEPGDYVVVRWRDSGLSADRTGEDADALKTGDLTNIGLVVRYDGEDLLLAVSWPDKADPANTAYWCVWVPSIISVTVLKEA